GFVAAAGNLADADFSAGRDRFTGLSGAVVNGGAITADQTVALIGRQVSNLGSIVSANGVVALSAGGETYLADAGGGKLMVKVSGGADLGSQTFAVDNPGTIKAARQVSLGAGDLYALAIRHGGAIKSPDVTIQAA